MQHNQWCMTSVSLWRRLFRDAAVNAFPPHWMSLSYQLFVWNCNTDLHLPSPLICMPTPSAQVCTIMRAEVCLCEWASCFVFHPVLCIALRKACPCSWGCRSPSSFSIDPSSYSHPQKHLFLTSYQHHQAAHTPFLSPLCTSSVCAGQSYLGLVYPAASFSSLLLRWACQHSIPISHPPSCSSSALLLTVQGKAGKLSLLAKVSLGWAAGLPLSLWRMILWMKTEEMGLGELLERLRTVTQSIGG